MVNSIKNNFLVSCVTVFSFAQADHNYINGIMVTPETVLDVVPSWEMAPNPLKQIAEQFVAHNKEKLVELTEIPIDKYEIDNKRTSNYTWVNTCYRGNKSDAGGIACSNNYMIPLYESARSTKILGLIALANLDNRLRTLYATTRGDSWHPLRRDDYASQDFVADPRQPLYQDISRAVYCAKLFSLQQGRLRDVIKTVPNYLVHIPGQSRTVQDGNYVIVQPYSDALAQSIGVDTKPSVIQEWGAAKVDAVRELIRKTPIYSCGSGNLRYNEKTGEIFCPDTKQANNNPGGKGFLYQPFTRENFPGYKQEGDPGYIKEDKYLFGQQKFNHDGSTEGLSEFEALVAKSA